MRIGIPAEVKNHEYRVAITPAGVHELMLNGHEVFVQAEAGTGSSITDAEYQAAGAQILPTADDVWGTGDLILKVKEPIAEEYDRMRAGPDPVHLPAPGRRQAAHRGAAGPPGHRHRLRDRADARTARCPCWPRCPRWPASRRRWARPP